MPLELQIIRASEFLRVGPQGTLDLAASIEILRLLAGACARRGIDRAMLDLRDVHAGPTPMLTSEDLATLVNAFCEMGFSPRLRLAILYTSDPHRRARLFSFLTTLRGWNVKASDNFETALTWLSQGAGAEPQKEAGEQEIPVRVKRMADDRTRRAKPRENTRGANETRPLSKRRGPSRPSSR